MDPNAWKRGNRDSFTLTAATGVYALFLKEDTGLPGINTAPDRLLYIGKANGEGGFRRRCHFDGKTGNHSPRKSLAVLLKDELNLEACPVHKPSGRHSWGLRPASELRLSNWMRESLEVAIHPCDDPSSIEKELISAHCPPLNLRDCFQTAAHVEISRLRLATRKHVLGTQKSTKTGVQAAPFFKAISSLGRAMKPSSRQSLTTAGAIATEFRLNPKSYRAELRREFPSWHEHGSRWLVSPGSDEQRQMLRVAERMAGNSAGA